MEKCWKKVAERGEGCSESFVDVNRELMCSLASLSGKGQAHIQRSRIKWPGGKEISELNIFIGEERQARWILVQKNKSAYCEFESEEVRFETSAFFRCRSQYESNWRLLVKKLSRISSIVFFCGIVPVIRLFVPPFLREINLASNWDEFLWSMWKSWTARSWGTNINHLVLVKAVHLNAGALMPSTPWMKMHEKF